MASWSGPWSKVWVADNWFGEGVAASADGDWIGTRWHRPGWVVRGWALQGGDPPTQISASDTLGISLSELVGTPRVKKFFLNDTLNVGLGESFSLQYKRHVVASDVMQVIITTERQLKVTSPRTDTLALSVTETVASLNSGDLTFKSASDTLDITADDSGINQYIEAGDTLNLGISEARTYTVRLSKGDILNLSLGEVSNPQISGPLQFLVSDTVNIGILESSSTVKFRQIQVTDTLGAVLGESANITDAITVTYLQVFDSLDISLEEAQQTTINSDVAAKYGTDSLDVTLDEQRNLIFLFFFTAGDTLNMALGEAITVNKSSVDASWEDVDIPWGGSNLRDLRRFPIMLKGTEFYQAEKGNDFHGKPITVLLERLGLTIYGRDRQGQWKEDPDLWKIVNGVYPIFRGPQGTVIKIFIGSQDTPEDPITWSGPHEFTIGRSYFVDPWISGRYISIRFESIGQPPWQLLSYDLDIKPVGRGR